jgi:glycerol uptake facilitator-like aquaporin
MSAVDCMCIEGWGTGILVFVIFCVTDPRNAFFGKGQSKSMFPFFIGFTVACLISLYGAHTSGSFNPAREFGPRLIAYMAGWGSVALPGYKGGWWAYIIGPLVGGPIGGALHDFIIARGYPETTPPKDVKNTVLSETMEASLMKLISDKEDEKSRQIHAE